MKLSHCQNNICTADVHNQDREKDTEGLCFLSKHNNLLDEDFISVKTNGCLLT